MRFCVRHRTVDRDLDRLRGEAARSKKWVSAEGDFLRFFMKPKLF